MVALVPEGLLPTVTGPTGGCHGDYRAGSTRTPETMS